MSRTMPTTPMILPSSSRSGVLRSEAQPVAEVPGTW
jgi:hypothetical protein